MSSCKFASQKYNSRYFFIKVLNFVQFYEMLYLDNKEENVLQIKQ
jgi:hypothetical protein